MMLIYEEGEGERTVLLLLLFNTISENFTEALFFFPPFWNKLLLRLVEA